MKAAIINVSRRDFVKAGLLTGTGLTLGLLLPSAPSQAGSGPGKTEQTMAENSHFEPNAFIRINTDNTVTVVSKHLEMGQGTYTGLATLIAEELDADWDQIKVIGAPADAAKYNNLFWGKSQGTGGSTSIANAYKQMRNAGAAAREMLINAAAQKWQVAAELLTIDKGVIQHLATAKKATFGELAELAAQQSVPQSVLLKDPEAFRLIGTKLPRKDTLDKINGTAKYTQDVQLDNMLTAVVAHPPRFGAKLKDFDAIQAKTVPGVIAVVAIKNGVAVLAKDFWSATKGRQALKINWDESQSFKKSSADILADYQKLSQTPGLIAQQSGDITPAFNNAKQTISANYVFPYLAHAAMEPMNCVVKLDTKRCDIWNGAQLHTGDQYALANLFNLKPEQIHIHMLYAGGSFGRRANPHSDYVLEAASIAKAIQGKHPIKLVWTREDDMQAGYYRPMYYHTLKAALDQDNQIIAWQHHIVGQSIIKGTPFESAMVKNGIDHTSVEGASNLPYAIPNRQVHLHTTDIPVPVQWWRAVGSTHTAFATETFIDELATRSKQDPYQYRRQLLKDHPRHLGVLDLVAKKSNWGQSLAHGKGRGIAVHESFNSYVAQVAEVTLKEGIFSVDRVVIAVDCGIAINPDIIKAQMEGGMGYGLAATLSSAITLKDGHIQESNFHDYTVLRMNQMPKVEVYIVKSGEAPSGVGEPATPVIAPAVANALYQASGKRYYQLPIKLTS